MPVRKGMTTFEFKISLIGSDPLVWRRISIPAAFNFYQFHLAIQAAFGWENSHLFEFVGDSRDKVRIGVPAVEDPITDARKITLKKLFRDTGDNLFYIYDFGDNWRHKIELEAVTDEEVYTALCTTGENECPPEDSGGVAGYSDILETFASGAESAKNEYRQWLALANNESWDPKRYDQREVNKRMALLIPEKLLFCS